MPHLSFFAARDDIRVIMDFAIHEAGCSVFEAYSVPGHQLRELSSSDAALSVYDADLNGLLAVLYRSSMGGRHCIHRIAMSLRDIPGISWRERLDGWGLIQLVLPRPIDGRLRVASTNHNSEIRARAASAQNPEIPPVEEWDFKEVTRISSKLNRFIRKLAVDQHKDGTSILSGAKALTADGSITLG